MRGGNRILAVALGFACTAAALHTGAQGMTDIETGDQRTRQRRVVEAWLMRAPFDELRPDLGPEPFSYEAWFDEGRALPLAVDTLVGFLAGEDLERPSGRGMRAAYALGWIGDGRPEAIKALLRALGSRDVALRMEAAAALGRLGDATLAPRLEAVFLNPQEDENVRANACIALGRLAAPSSLPILTSALTAPNPFIASSAKEALRLYQAERN
jgi:hypothetical protein